MKWFRIEPDIALSLLVGVIVFLALLFTGMLG